MKYLLSMNFSEEHLNFTRVSLTTILIIIFASCAPKPENESRGADQFPFLEMQVSELHDHYLNGKFTVEEVVQSYLDRIEALDDNGPELNAIITVNPGALEIARQLDEEIRNGEMRSILHGIPIVIKDNINTLDNMPTTAGSRSLAGSFAGVDAFHVAKLREAGAVILGKANLSEWANFRGELSSSGWSGVGGQTHNPYVIDRNPCGSSSGSGVAVSANLTMLAIGTETNGSIVCPSHANGIVGLKPTLGLISRHGVIPIATSLDVAGPMGRTVADVAAMLGVLAGTDPSDDSTVSSDSLKQKDYTQFLDRDGLNGKRIGIYTAPLGANYKVDTLFYQAVEDLKLQGAEVIELDQVVAPGTGAHAFKVMLHEYKDGLNAYFASLGDDAPVKSLDELIAFNLSDSLSLSIFNQQYLEMANATGGMQSEDYLSALKSMREGALDNGINKVMNELELDAIIAPTGSPAWKTDHINGDSFQLGSSSPAAWSGGPNITVPMGFVDGLPVGISFFGKMWSEPKLLEIAYAYEQSTQHRRAPEFIGWER